LSLTNEKNRYRDKTLI